MNIYIYIFMWSWLIGFYGNYLSFIGLDCCKCSLFMYTHIYIISIGAIIVFPRWDRCILAIHHIIYIYIYIYVCVYVYIYIHVISMRRTIRVFCNYTMFRPMWIKVGMWAKYKVWLLLIGHMCVFLPRLYWMMSSTTKWYSMSLIWPWKFLVDGGVLI